MGRDAPSSAPGHSKSRQIETSSWRQQFLGFFLQSLPRLKSNSENQVDCKFFVKIRRLTFGRPVGETNRGTSGEDWG
jgi:hypothetical protein